MGTPSVAWASSEAAALDADAQAAARREIFLRDGYLVVPRLLSGSELLELDRMVYRLLDGDLKPDREWKGNVLEDFHARFEPGMEERDDIPRRDRIRTASGLFHYSSYFNTLGRSAAITSVLSSLFGGDGVQMLFGDMVFVKPPNGIESALHQARLSTTPHFALTYPCQQ